jgi:hypothetical protein
MLIANAQLFAAFSAAGSQHAATVLGSHSLTETVLVHSSAIVGLECSFHRFFYVLFVLFLNLGCKSTHFFLNNKELCDF